MKHLKTTFVVTLVFTINTMVNFLGIMLSTMVLAMVSGPGLVLNHFVEASYYLGALFLVCLLAFVGVVLWNIRQGRFYPSGRPKLLLGDKVPVFLVPRLRWPLMLVACAVVAQVGQQLAKVMAGPESWIWHVFINLPATMVLVAFAFIYAMHNLKYQMWQVQAGERLLTGQPVHTVMMISPLQTPIVQVSEDEWVYYNEGFEIWLLTVALHQAQQPWYTKLHRHG